MRLILATLLAVSASAAVAQTAKAPVDFTGFQTLTADVRDYRNSRLVGWDEFAEAARQPDALLLDARSADAYAEGHIKGAVNLPLTDFTPESLAAVIGPRDRPILIYCNNNFRNDARPVMMKSAALALNIQTFINLVGYGYPNVRELNELIDFNDPKVGWVKGSAPGGTAT